MKKFEELYFLLSLPGIGKATAIKKYGEKLEHGIQLDALVEFVKKEEIRLDTRTINNALDKAKCAVDGLAYDTDIQAITIYDDNYPIRLHDLKGKAPVILYAKGNSEVLIRDGISIVGTRKPSEWSERVEDRIVQKIIESSGRVITSGLALGCDYIAHKSTIDHKGITAAVLPSGFNVISPKQHIKLAEQIIENGGCLVTEYEPNTYPTNMTYVERDAIIAALTDATLVVQCGEKSGTMHTANTALKLGRKLACFYCDNFEKGDYSGNRFLIQKMQAQKIADAQDLFEFLNNKVTTLETSSQMSLYDYI